MDFKMGKFSKPQRKAPDSDSGSQEESEADEMLEDKYDDGGGEYSDDNEEDIDGDEQNEMTKDAELEEVENESTYIQQQEQDLLRNLKHHKDEDFLKGQAVKNQKAIWDKTLEFRFLLQKAFSSSNRLPKEPLKSSFCDIDGRVNEAYSELLTSSKKTLDSLLELQEALIEKNPSVARARDGQPLNHSEASRSSNGENDPEWSHISEMHSRIAPFRNESIDKWHRKTQVVIATKSKLHAFNQNVSEQVAGYMRDPSRMIKGMQQSRSTVAVFGIVPDVDHNTKDEDTKVDVDPELLDDSDFYQQLLKEFFETFDPTSSETAFYALKKMQTKKRKIVDRRASKSRKIRYRVHEKIVNFMSPQPMQLTPMASKLFENLFGLRTLETSHCGVAK